MVLCEFEVTPVAPDKYQHTCKVCHVVRVTGRPKHMRNCDVQGHLLGDKVERLLTAIGVTKMRWRQLFFWRAEKTCGCSKRQRKLNAWQGPLPEALAKVLSRWTG